MPNDIIKTLNESEELKKSFDLWVLNLDIKDGVGGRPDLFSLLHSCQYVLAEQLRRKLGMMRQWLNEDRITDNSKLVSTEDLLKWFK